MNNFKKWLVALDNTEMDDHLFRFINSADKPIDYKELHFIHIASSVGLTDKVGTQNRLEEGIEKIKNELQAKIENNLPGKVFSLTLLQGNPGKHLISISKEINPDLLVLGRKAVSGAEGVKPEELVAVANCSTLLLPGYLNYSFNSILAAVDFSEISIAALKAAIKISDKADAQLQVQHVCTIPSDFRRTGKSYEEYAEKLKIMADREATEFLNHFNLKPGILYTYADKNETADSIAAFAKNNKADLLIMGSKGRTNAAAVFMGSIAEKTAKLLNDIPLMVVKEKNANLNLLQAIVG